MTTEQKEFEAKYHGKKVRPLGNYYKNLPQKEYIVTAALLNWEDNGKTTIFAIKALDYNLENKHWTTFYISDDDFDKTMSDFEIVGDRIDNLEDFIFKGLPLPSLD